ncbi:MAG: hypothetical protein ABEJ69_02190 [Candidatus Nanohaloarchaea archaeon]
MWWDKALGRLLYFQLAMLAVVAGAIFSFVPEKSAGLRLFEIFGALVASTITVFGIREMRMLTSD